MAMDTLLKRSASGIQTTMICLIPSAQNSATQKATHTDTHVDMTFPTNTTARHASGKMNYMRMCNN